MPKQQTRQAGGAKEAPLVIVGSDEGSQLPPFTSELYTYTPKDAEYQYYHDLLRGYVGIFARWQEAIMETVTQQEKPKRSAILEVKREIFQTPAGLIIKPREKEGNPGLQHPLDHERVANVGFVSVNNLGDCSHIKFRTGEPGKPFIIDQNGMPIDAVEISVNSNNPTLPTRGYELGVSSQNNSGRGKRGENRHAVSYRLDGVILRINRGILFDNPMTDEYATDLFGKLDALIPGSQPITRQPSRRVTLELQAPRPLPAPRRGMIGR